MLIQTQKQIDALSTVSRINKYSNKLAINPFITFFLLLGKSVWQLIWSFLWLVGHIIKLWFRGMIGSTKNNPTFGGYAMTAFMYVILLPLSITLLFSLTHDFSNKENATQKAFAVTLDESTSQIVKMYENSQEELTKAKANIEEKILEEKNKYITDRIGLSNKAQEYITKYQMGISPLTGSLVVDISERYNIEPALVLVMAHKESHFGTNGRAVETRNIMNVGNFDCGDTRAASNDGCSKFMASYQAGVEHWANYVTQCYGEPGKTLNLARMYSINFRVQNSVDDLCGGLVGKAYMSGCNSDSVCEIVKSQYRELEQLVHTFID